MHPTQVIEIFGNVSIDIDIQVLLLSLILISMYYGDRPRGTHPSGELNSNVKIA